MTDEQSTEAEEPDAGFPAEEAFALIGNDLRAEILRVLGETPHEGLSFSDLRERVEADVDSGQFNYHLQKLVGHFVERTDDGYELRAAGLALYRAIQAGSFNRRVSIEPFAAGFDCYFCGTPAEAVYDDGSFVIECPGCDHVFTHTMLPPSAVDDDRDALLARVDQFNRHRMLVAARGVCPVCASEMELSFRTGSEVWSEGSERLDVFVHRKCVNCGQGQFMTVGLALLYHPTLVAFFEEHGRDLTAIPHWELEFVMTDAHTTVRSQDPLEVTLAVTCDDETLAVVVDEELNVVETTLDPE